MFDKNTKFPTIIYSDDSATVNIATKISMTNTVLLVRLNQRHQRSSQCLSTFQLEARHSPGKHNVVPDALSCLNVKNSGNTKLQLDKNSSENIQENMYPKHKALSNTQLWGFPVSIVQVSKKFLDKLKNAHQNDNRYVRLINQIKTVTKV